MNERIGKKLSTLPDDPGVYLMRNQLDQVIYVGKAKNLKKRVRQYFKSGGSRDKKVQILVSQIHDFEYIIVENEVESLILESNLIKEYQPKYNILLRDDKQYPYIKITADSFPRVIKTRDIQKDQGKYYGPYPNALAVNEAIEIFHEYYPLRNCTLDLSKGNTTYRPCLNYFIDRCKAPCQGLISEAEYNGYITSIMHFLDGKNQSLQRKIENNMKRASEKLDFEKAAIFRDQLASLQVLLEKQVITDAGSSEEYDMIHFARDEKIVCVQIFFMRNGKISGREHFIVHDPYGDSVENIFQAFITQFYHGSAYIPSRIYLPIEIPEKELVESYLSNKKGTKANILVPKVGEKRKILRLVHKNALDMLVKHSSSYLEEYDKQAQTLVHMKEELNLQELPMRIEAYDISNISGVESVGSMVVFENGRAKKSDYRRFRIKTVQGPDDYSSLKEVLIRRFNRGLREKEEGNKITSFSYFPDLILMDGGKGQVNIAKQILEEFQLEIPVAGLVKDEKHTTRGMIYENREYIMGKTTDIYRLIYQIQEEAHRFAITYHRSLRSKSTFRSELEDIPLIGNKRRQKLMIHFKSLSKIKDATIEELLCVEGMNQSAAQSVWDYFHENKGDKS